MYALFSIKGYLLLDGIPIACCRALVKLWEEHKSLLGPAVWVDLMVGARSKFLHEITGSPITTPGSRHEVALSVGCTVMWPPVALGRCDFVLRESSEEGCRF